MNYNRTILEILLEYSYHDVANLILKMAGMNCMREHLYICLFCNKGLCDRCLFVACDWCLEHERINGICPKCTYIEFEFNYDKCFDCFCLEINEGRIYYCDSCQKFIWGLYGHNNHVLIKNIKKIFGKLDKKT